MINAAQRNDPLSAPPRAIFSHEAAERGRLRIRSERMEAKARAPATLAESYELLRQAEEALNFTERPRSQSRIATPDLVTMRARNL